MENLYLKALEAMNAHIGKALAGTQDHDTLKKELMAKPKQELVEMLISTMQSKSVTVESVAKTILEDPACDFLTYHEIAAGIAVAMNSDTSAKSIASYASKNAKNKGWQVVPRRSTAARQAELSKLMTKS